MIQAEVYENWVGNIELTYPKDVPLNPFPNTSFRITLCKGSYGYYFRNSGYLGHEPKDVAEKWRELFDTNYSRENCGSKEKMINRMNDFINWLIKYYEKSEIKI